MERAQRILKKFSKILKEQGAGPLFTTFKGYVTYALYDRWKVRRLRKFPPRMVKNRILFETNDDFTDNCRILPALHCHIFSPSRLPRRFPGYCLDRLSRFRQFLL